MITAQQTNQYFNSGSDYMTNTLEDSPTFISEPTINPMWLIALLLIPFIYVLYRGINEITNQTSYPSYPVLVGTKGGKAKHMIKKEPGIKQTKIHKMKKQSH